MARGDSDNLSLSTRIRRLESEYLIRQVTRDLIHIAIDVAEKKTKTALQDISKFYAKETALRRSEFREMYTEIGRAANAEVIKSKGIRSKIPPYRLGSGEFDRFGGGKLAAALGNDNMFTSAYDGLAYGNISFLNKEARQWARLNFGAGSRGASSKGPRQFPIMFFGQKVGTMGLNKKPSPAFTIPPGFFVSPAGSLQRKDAKRRGKDQFFLELPDRRASRAKPKLTAGISARNYLDAGIGVIAEQLPKKTSAKIAQIVKDSVKQGLTKGPVAQANLSKSRLQQIIREANKYSK